MVTTDIEAWRLVVEHWRAQGKDLRHLEVPPELASQLGVPMEVTKERRRESETEEEEDDMAKTTQKKQKTAPKKGSTKSTTKSAPAKKTSTKASSAEPVPVATTPEDAMPPVGTGELQHLGEREDIPKWKKRSQFEGDTCGLSGCSKKANGYVAGIRSTKEGERDKRSLWYGPACHSCADLLSPGMKATSLAELAHQRNGVSDLALLLDLEVGEVQKRLAAAGINEKGRPLNEQPGSTIALSATAVVAPAPGAFQPPVNVQNPTEEVHLAVVIPNDIMGAIGGEMNSSLMALQSFVVRSQGDMDYSSTYMQRVKGLFNQLDEKRKELGRPLREKIEQINAYFKPTLDLLEQVETTIKQKVDEGYRWSQQQLAQGLGAAQAALAAGNTQGVAMATQQAMAADMSLSKGVTMRPKLKFEVQNPAVLPGTFWSPDSAKVQAYLDGLDQEQLQAAVQQGMEIIPGVRVWYENVVSARAA